MAKDHLILDGLYPLMVFNNLWMALKEERIELKEVQSLPANWWERRSSVTTTKEDEEDENAWQHLTEEEESLAQEEESLQKEIEEEERKSIDAEVEKHAVAAENEEESHQGPTNENHMGCGEKRSLPVDRPMVWQDIVARWQVESHILASVNWGELVETELSEVRQPGQAIQMHEKLSSPSRKRNLEDVGRRHEEKLAKADELRQNLMKEQTQKLKELSKRVEEVRAKRQELMERKRCLMESRMARAAENRELQLQAIVKKAKDEDEKVLEIAFINNLEADGRRHEVMVRHHDHELRLQYLQVERQRKVEEKAAREAAAEERRKVAAEERACRLRELAERKRKRQEQIEIHKTELERERLQAAKEKAKEREGRLAELKAAKEANTEELKHKLFEKQEQTNRRHEENLEMIKMRASEMSARNENPCTTAVDGILDGTRHPSCKPYPCLKLCSLCHVLISNEVHLVAHLESQKHLTAKGSASANGCVIVDAPEGQISINRVDPIDSEKGKNVFKKRRQKLRQKMQFKCREYEDQKKENFDNCLPDSPQKNKLYKVLTELKNKVDTAGTDKVWLPADVHFLERSLGELNRIMSAENQEKQQRAYWRCFGPDILLKLLSASETDKNRLIVPLRSVTNAVNVIKASLIRNGKTCLEMIYSNRLSTVIDVLSYHTKIFSASEETLDWTTANLIISLTEIIVTSLTCVLSSGKDWCFWNRVPEGKNGFRTRVSLMASYLVVSGFPDCFTSVVRKWTKGSARLNQTQERLILAVVELFRVFVNCFIFNDSQGDPYCQASLSVDNGGSLVCLMESSRLFGLFSVLYMQMICPDHLENGRPSASVDITTSTVSLAEAVLRLLNSLAALSHSTVKDILSCDYTSLEFRHFISRLMVSSSYVDKPELLHQSIVAVGHFVCENSDNQTAIQSGFQPSILQQLCVLPFSYFSDPKLTRILFPTLIACTYQHNSNRAVLEKELNGILLAAYLEDENNAEESRKAKQKTCKLSEDLFDLKLRFPVVSWLPAQAYFQTTIEGFA